MTIAAADTLPRIGARRDLRVALETYWRGARDLAALEAEGRALRARRWRAQQAAGLGAILSGDVSFCDPALDMTAALGAVPARFAPPLEGEIGLATRLAMARGSRAAPAMGRARWFGAQDWVTAPELAPGQRFRLASLEAVRLFQEARALGVQTRPVLLGPVSWLSLAPAADDSFDPLTLLPGVLAVYAELLGALAEAGAERVRVEEPVLACDLGAMRRAAFWTAYDELAKGPVRLTVALGGGAPAASVDVALKLPVAGLHLDLADNAAALSQVLAGLRPGAALSLGAPLVSGAGEAALLAAYAPLARARWALGAERVETAPPLAWRDDEAAAGGGAAPRRNLSKGDAASAADAA